VICDDVLAGKLENAGIVLGGGARGDDGRACDVHEVDLTVALQSVLANLDSILTVLVGDATRTAHRSGLCLEFGYSRFPSFEFRIIVGNGSALVLKFRIDGAQLYAPAPPLGTVLSMPLRASERSLTRARGYWERAVRVMVVM